ncbi:reticulon-like protein B8 [Carica papaya]|uniref:reticulon-like protein B8 n=1 Tax=Carica papaya TaxID=3649 RepID=UPI000B8C7468|nr:reticulon-like protein B8 [Carica papaya]
MASRSPSKVPRLVVPAEVFVNIGVAIGGEVNRALGFLQDVACGGNLKQFLVVVVSLWAAAVIGSWCNFLTVVYIGFVAAHTLPVLYERYEDQVDNLVYKILDQLQNHYRKLDSSVLSKIPKGKLEQKKHE